MGTEKIKEKIFEILEHSLNKYAAKSPLFIFQEIHSAFQEARKDISFSFKEFEVLFSDFKKNARKDLPKAEMLFFESALKRKKAQKIDIPFACKKEPPKREKRGRDRQWKELKDAWDILNNPECHFYLNDDMKQLLSWRNYLLDPDGPTARMVLPRSLRQKPHKVNSPAYILYFLGLTAAQYENDSEIREKVEAIMLKLQVATAFLQKALNMLRPLTEKNEKAKMWVTDIFGDSTFQVYNPVIHRRSYHKPNYPKSYDLFVRFLNGETCKQLGYTKNTWGRFTEQIRPQGMVELLYKIYSLLYGMSDSISGNKYSAKVKVKETLNRLPRFLQRQIFKELYQEEFDIK